MTRARFFELYPEFGQAGAIGDDAIDSAISQATDATDGSFFASVSALERSIAAEAARILSVSSFSQQARITDEGDPSSLYAAERKRFAKVVAGGPWT